jgi:hypothetical protein
MIFCLIWRASFHSWIIKVFSALVEHFLVFSLEKFWHALTLYHAHVFKNDGDKNTPLYTISFSLLRFSIPKVIVLKLYCFGHTENTNDGPDHLYLLIVRNNQVKKQGWKVLDCKPKIQAKRTARWLPSSVHWPCAYSWSQVRISNTRQK